MKAIGGIGLLIFVGLSLYWFALAAGDDKDAPIQIQVAFGAPGPNGVEMHAVVGVVMANRDRATKDGRLINWNEWVAGHFELKDADGNPVKIERRNNSSAIQQREVIGTQEFFLVATLTEGRSYAFDYIPTMANPAVRYRYTFSAPADAQKVRMADFQKVK